MLAHMHNGRTMVQRVQRVQRAQRACLGIRCESYKVISSLYGADKMAIMDNVCGELHESGAHAITTLILNMNNKCIVEKDITRVTKELQDTIPKYINLRKLALFAPYAALDGSHIEALMNLDCPYTELELYMWTFHSPYKHMWTGRDLNFLDLEINDGIAFPYAVHDLLIGLAEHQEESLNELIITNNTPHLVSIPHKLLPYAEKTRLNRIELQNKHLGSWLF